MAPHHNLHTPKKDLVIVTYGQRVWDAMFLESTEEVINEETVSVYRGRYSALFDSLGISRTHYTPIRSLLIETGCMTHLQSGGNGRSTVIVLHKPLTEAAVMNIPRRRLTEPVGTATLRRVKALEGEVQALKAWRESVGEGLNLAKVLRNLEKRISAIEKRENAKPTAIKQSKQAKD
jgi:hypothetical protein